MKRLERLDDLKCETKFRIFYYLVENFWIRSNSWKVSSILTNSVILKFLGIEIPKLSEIMSCLCTGVSRVPKDSVCGGIISSDNPIKYDRLFQFRF